VCARSALRRPERSWHRIVLAAQEENAPAAEQHPFPEEADFDLLSNKIAEVTKNLNEELCGCSIYLVGMMGSGKSTVSI